MNTQTASTNHDTDLKELLASRSSGRTMRRSLGLAVLLLVLASFAFFFLRSEDKTAQPRFKTEPAAIDTLVVTVSATGNLQPTNQVDVGSELSGIIDQVFVDVNDRVSKGQILARLDLAKLQDAVTRSRANLAATEAQLVQAQATVAEKQADLERLRTVRQLSAGKLPATADMDAAEAELKRAIASEGVARASVSQAQAELQSDETNLRKASLRSPINGVVLSREAEPGQTVAASFQAPVLFTLAEDLAKMELQVDVDEADVGQVREGQNATFGVDAWPGRKYDAVITRVSYGSQEKENVISYLTVLAVSNEDLSLRPGMTGTAEITTLKREKALLVPNAALRFSPPETETAQVKGGGSLLGALMPRPPRQPTQKIRQSDTTTQRVWVLSNGQPVPVEVETGATNGRMTEIRSGDLEVGTEVITETLEHAS